MEPRSPRKLRVACLQLNSRDHWRKNLEFIRAGIRSAVSKKAKLIVFPENCLFRGEAHELCQLATKVTPAVLDEIRDTAKKKNLAILVGGIPEKSNVRGKVYNTAYLVSAGGRIAAQYRKIHLFDNRLKKIETAESCHIVPGRKLAIANIFGIRMGISICYDLRFPELFRKLAFKGARVIFVTANFTYETGRAHWEVLLRARAIENQVFIIAAGQVGVHPASGIRSFGSSLIIDPWGKVLARASRTSEEMIVADLTFAAQDSLRSLFPVLSHRRIID
jgi:predicted amidohydrolase